MRNIFFIFTFAISVNLSYGQHCFYQNGVRKCYAETYSSIYIWGHGNFQDEVKFVVADFYKVTDTGTDNYLLPLIKLTEDEYKSNYIHLSASVKITSAEYKTIIRKLNKIDNIEYVSYSFMDSIGRIFTPSRYILLHITNNDFSSKLADKLLGLNAKVVAKNQFSPNWYTAICHKNEDMTSYDVASAIYETGLVKSSDPDMISPSVNYHCVNDINFSSQWALNNTSYPNIDLSMCNAWGITTGNPNIVTAILDGGFQTNHPDLNVYSLSHDAATNSSPSGWSSHGTECAGIIGMIRNNRIGGVGVCPNSKVMSISMGQIFQNIADAIAWAWQNGADVLSCSWSLTSSSSIVEQSIIDAMTQGRNGLGCVIVFSSGNSNGAVEYPANFDSRLLVVGAIDKCGIRAGNSFATTGTCNSWCYNNSTNCSPGSCYSQELDVAAPGSHIYTTTLTNSQGLNWTDFSGTSASCPHVAGVAALILSVNPCLTHGDVHNIICASAKKITTSKYSYTSSSAHPLGTWNSELGYGLVNADVAVNLARTLYLQNITETSTQNYLYSFIRAGNNVSLLSLTTGNYVVSNSGDVTLRATNEISLEDGFEAASGSFLDAYIETSNPPCSDWSPPVVTRTTPLALSDVQHAEVDAGVENNELLSSHPIPFSTYVSLTYTLPVSGNVLIKLVDVYGRCFFISEKLELSGNHQIEIKELANLASGVYSVVVCQGNQCHTLKLLKSE